MPISAEDANSHNAEKTPPSETACKVIVSFFGMIFITFSISVYFFNSTHLCTKPGLNFLRSSSFLSEDITAVPPTAMVPAITTCIPGFTSLLSISLISLFLFPKTVM